MDPSRLDGGLFDPARDDKDMGLDDLVERGDLNAEIWAERGNLDADLRVFYLAGQEEGEAA